MHSYYPIILQHNKNEGKEKRGFSFTLLINFFFFLEFASLIIRTYIVLQSLQKVKLWASEGKGDNIIHTSYPENLLRKKKGETPKQFFPAAMVDEERQL